MRILRRATPLCLLLLLTSAAFGQLAFQDQLLVYTNDKKGAPRESVKDVFVKALTGNKPVVLFVHGRGDEPQKSLGPARLLGLLGGAVKKIEQHGVTVVMFSWDSKHGDGREDRSRPLANMARSAERFGQVLDELVRAQAELDTRGIRRQPITLLAHSMGTIVLPTYLSRADRRWPGAQPLFRAAVLTSSDADREGHHTWVDEIGRVERVFVTINPADKVLTESAKDRTRASGPLGQNRGTVRSSRATYIFLRDGAHELFAKGSHQKLFETLFRRDLATLPAPGQDLVLQR